MAKIVIDSKITDLTTSWENYTGQRIEELLKEYLSDHDENKIGYITIPRQLQSDGYYHVQCFASQEAFDKYTADSETYAALKLYDVAIPLVENNGTTYAARLSTSLTTSDPIVSKVKEYWVPVMFKGIQATSGVSENAGIRANVVIQRTTDGGTTWSQVGTTSLPSVDPDATSYTSVNIGQYFSDTNPQQIRLRASYSVLDDDDNVIANAQSAWLTFSNITYTTLSLNFAYDFSFPINGKTRIAGNEGFPIRYTLTGEVARRLHLKFTTASGYTYTTWFEINAGEYTNSLSYYTNTINDNNLLANGIVTIEAWLTCSDGVTVEGIESDHITNQVLVLNEDTTGADLTKSWILIENVSQEAVNYVSMDSFLKFAVWVPSEEDPFVASTDSVSIAFILGDYGTDGTSWDIEYFRNEQTVTAGQQYTLPATIEIENSVDNTLYGYLHVTRTVGGVSSDFLYSSCGKYNFSVQVDNTEKFSPTSGVDFFLNPKNRNNSEENPMRIINAATGDEVSAKFTGFEAINDLWVTSTDDNQKVLRVKAGQTLSIDYDWLLPFKTVSTSNVTLELDFKVKNVTNETDPIIQFLENLTTGFIGVKMAPMTGLVYSKNYTTDEAQDFRWQEDERTHVTINIVSALHSTAEDTVTLPLCRVFVNGVINREFIFAGRNENTGAYDIESDEWYKNGSSIVIGQSQADIDIYSIRCYRKELTSANILKDYIATLPTSEEKLAVRDANKILNASGTISSDLVKGLGKNVIIWHGTQPSHNVTTVPTGWWEIHMYNEDGTEDPDRSGTICKKTGKLEPTRQGSTANTYYYSNIQTKLGDVEDTIFVPLDKIHSDYSYEATDVVTEDGVQGIRDVDGWIDGNGLYHGPYFRIDSSCPLGQKFVLKINYASSMQSHLMGGCKMYNDLHKLCAGTNYLQQKDSKARVAKFQAPFYYFTQASDDAQTIYQGPGTFGPGKADDKTWGYSKSKDYCANFCIIEGSDNNLPLTDFRVPWNPNRISCEIDTKEGEVTGWIYNKQTSLDLDKFVKTKRDVVVSTWSEVEGEQVETRETLQYKTVNATVEQKIIDLVNFLYSHNTKITYYNGTFDAFKSATGIDTNMFYWCTSGTEAFCLKRYDQVDGAWVDAGWDATNNTNVARNLSTEFSISNSGGWAAMNTAFINAIATDARDHMGEYFKVDSILFHYAFINSFLAGTDNCSKNTYYVLAPQDANGTYLWEMHQDDVDTVLATDNSGFQTKPYYIDRQHPYAEGSTKCLYEGSYNVLFNLIESAYEAHGDIRNMMHTMFTNMCKLVSDSDGVSLTPWGALQKYYFSTQEYFSATAYNEAARIRYEYPSTLGFVSDRNVKPITQSMGDQLQAEKQYMKRRLVLFASYAEWGDFERATSGNLGIDDTTTNFGIEATTDVDGNSTNVIFQLIPHQYIYPTGCVGETTKYLRKRCEPGQTYSFHVNDSPVVGDTNVVLYGANYYRSFGNLGDLSVLSTRDLTVTGKRLIEFTAEPTVSGKAQFRPHTLTINAPLIETFSIKNCSGITGSINLSNSIRLKTIDARGTSLTNITLPQSATTTAVRLPDTLTALTTVKLPSVVTFTVAGYSALKEVSLAGIPLVDTYSLVDQFRTNNAPITSISVYNVNWTSATPTVMDYLEGIGTSKIYGTVNFTDNKYMTYERKLAYMAKWGNIDDPTNDLYMTYATSTNVNKIYSIALTGRKYVDTVSTYQFKVIPYGSAGTKNIYGNDFSSVTWSYSGYQEGDETDDYNWIEAETGIFHANKFGTEESSSFSGTVTCTMTRTDDIPLTQTYTVYLYHRKARVGDLVFADGTYSDEVDVEKTVVGVCFYISPKDETERLAVARVSLGGQYWGLYNDSSYMSGVAVTDDAGLTSAQIYDLKDLSNITGAPLTATSAVSSGSNYYIRDDNYRDDSTSDGFKDYKGMYSVNETYTKTDNGSNYIVAGRVGYVTTIEDIRDNQDTPSQYAVKNDAGIYVIPSGTRVPWGYVQTLYIINHRNTILSYVITATDADSGEVTAFGLEIPGASETQSEWSSLADCMAYVKSTYKDAYQEIYYPAASKCYAYEPCGDGDSLILNDGETLSDKFKAHNWFLPSSGDLARLYWYHRQGYTVSDDYPNAIFANAYTSKVFTQFPSSSHWSSTEYNSTYSWDVGFSDGYFIYGHYLSKYYGYVVRPVVAF